MADENMSGWVRDGDGWQFVPRFGGVSFCAWVERGLFSDGSDAIGLDAHETGKGSLRVYMAPEDWRDFAALPAADAAASPAVASLRDIGLAPVGPPDPEATSLRAAVEKAPPPAPDALACPLCHTVGCLAPRTDGERYDCGACGGTVRARVVDEFGPNAARALRLLRLTLASALGLSADEAVALSPADLAARVGALRGEADRLRDRLDHAEKAYFKSVDEADAVRRERDAARNALADATLGKGRPDPWASASPGPWRADLDSTVCGWLLTDAAGRRVGVVERGDDAAAILRARSGAAGAPDDDEAPDPGPTDERPPVPGAGARPPSDGERIADLAAGLLALDRRETEATLDLWARVHGVEARLAALEASPAGRGDADALARRCGQLEAELAEARAARAEAERAARACNESALAHQLAAVADREALRAAEARLAAAEAPPAGVVRRDAKPDKAPAGGEPDAPPTAAAVLAAADFLRAARAEGLEPLEVDIDVMGGLGLHYSWPPGHRDGEAERWAWVACPNSGSASVHARARSGEAQSWGVDKGDPAPAAQCLAGFLRGAPPVEKAPPAAGPALVDPGPIAAEVEMALDHVYGAIVELSTRTGDPGRAKADAILARDALRALSAKLRGVAPADGAKEAPGTPPRDPRAEFDAFDREVAKHMRKAAGP